MYSRSYYPEAQREMNLPENYDGVAFTEPVTNSPTDDRSVSFSDEENREEYVKTGVVKPHISSDGGIKIPFLSGLFDGGLLSGMNLKIPTLGTEEVLIIATAAFLFFSKSGDRECAMLLLFLLLIN